MSSVEARLREVAEAKAQGNPDSNSLNQVLGVANGRLSAKPQPESDPYRHRFGALLVLTWTIETFATDAKLKRALQSDLRRLKADIVGLGA